MNELTRRVTVKNDASNINCQHPVVPVTIV